MKKILILAGVVGLLSSTQAFACINYDPSIQTFAPIEKKFMPMDNCSPGRIHKRPPFEQFEQKLKLTDEQKVKVKTLRDNEKEQIKPILDKIKTKFEEERAIMDKRLTFDERQAELAPIRKEIHELRAQIHEIKVKNKTEFENILTDKQLKELKQMKTEARKNFKKHHPEIKHRPIPQPTSVRELPPRQPVDM